VIFIESDHGPGVVAFIGGDSARYHAFTVAFTGLAVPENSKLYTGIGYNAFYNRNAVIEYALFGCDRCGVRHEGKDIELCKGYVPSKMQWVNIWDDDHTFGPNSLIKMLDRQVDIVVPLYAQRQPPYKPCIYKPRDEVRDGWPQWSWEELEGRTGLFPIGAAGAGGILVRRPVLEAMGPKNWFEHVMNYGEDMAFYDKALKLGFQPYVDLDVPIGHVSTYEVWPYNSSERWGSRVKLGGNPPQDVEFWPAKYQGQP
jgi:hypothetical protein